MWGEYYLRKNNKVVSASLASLKERENGKTIFVNWCLEPIWQIYSAVNDWFDYLFISIIWQGCRENGENHEET
jgi:hypothetical protein